MENKRRTQDTPLLPFPQAPLRLRHLSDPPQSPLPSFLLRATLGPSRCLPGGDGWRRTFCTGAGCFLSAPLCLSLWPSAAPALSPLPLALAGLLRRPQCLRATAAAMERFWPRVRPQQCPLPRASSCVFFRGPSCACLPGCAPPCAPTALLPPPAPAAPHRPEHRAVRSSDGPQLRCHELPHWPQLWRGASLADAAGTGCDWPEVAPRPPPPGPNRYLCPVRPPVSPGEHRVGGHSSQC